MAVKKLKPERELFCCWYAVLGNAQEAAIKAGFGTENALREGIECLGSEICRKRIEQIRNVLSNSGSIISGLKRLAYGNCSDAVYLAFSEELPPPDVIAKLDLFNVSELKRQKSGVVEIKFCDRLKALEKLYEIENSFSDKNRAEDLINALTSPQGDDDIENI
ncbi:MAG: terminase small subunit [Ruminococcus sp.]|nr:terminase small subunit [Ruminococcus sp.]